MFQFQVIISNDFKNKKKSLTLKLHMAKKFIPYKGFYPSERVEQLAALFNNYVVGGGSHGNPTYSLEVDNSVDGTGMVNDFLNLNSITLPAERKNSGLALFKYFSKYILFILSFDII